MFTEKEIYRNVDSSEWLLFYQFPYDNYYAASIQTTIYEEWRLARNLHKKFATMLDDPSFIAIKLRMLKQSDISMSLLRKEEQIVTPHYFAERLQVSTVLSDPSSHIFDDV